MSDDVDIRISPTLLPDLAGVIDDYDDDTRPLLGATETAVSEAYEALKNIHNAKAAAAKNPTLNEYAQLVQVDTFAAKAMTPVFQSWDRARNGLEANLAKMEQELYAPVEQRATASMASEIRRHFARLENDGARMNALRKAIEAGDEITATAVLGAPSYLSGLEPDLHAEYLRDWHDKRRPLEANKVRAMKAALQVIADRSGLLKQEWRKAVGDIKIYKTSNDGKRQILAQTITAADVRAQVKAANAPFAVPV